MAYDKLVDSSALDAGLRQIANAIREKGGTSDNLAFPAAMAEAIAAIESGGTIFGRKFITGSFTLAAETTADYTFVTAADWQQLLETGESELNYRELACIVYKQPGTTEVSSSGYAKTSLGAWSVPSYVVSGGTALQWSVGVVADSYGTVGGSSSGKISINYQRADMRFSASAKGSPNFEYRWIMWRTM